MSALKNSYGIAFQLNCPPNTHDDPIVKMINFSRAPPVKEMISVRVHWRDNFLTFQVNGEFISWHWRFSGNVIIWGNLLFYLNVQGHTINSRIHQIQYYRK